MSSDNFAAIQTIYTAFATGDIPTVLAGMSADIVWNEADDYPYADGNPYIGPEAIVAGVFARIGDDWESFGADLEELLDAGDTIIGRGRYSGTHKATGKAQDTQFAHVWKLSGGKVVSFQQYANTLHTARVTGAI